MADQRRAESAGYLQLHNRKNWVHIGSVDAGPRVAAILSVVETCRRLEIPVREYLSDVLPGLADRKGLRDGSAHAYREETPSLRVI